MRIIWREGYNMACMTISKTFFAEHGTHQRRRSLYTIQIGVTGNIVLGYTNHCDSKILERKLEKICKELQDQYLDEKMGRATHEMVAVWILNQLGTLIDTVTVSADDIIVVVNKADLLKSEFNVILLQQKGIRSLMLGDFDGAERLFEEAINKDKNNAESYLLRGRVYRYTGKYRLAKDDFEVVIRLKPDWSEGYRNMGNILLFMKKYNDMVPYFVKATELAPYSSLAYNNLGYAYYCLESWDKALACSLRAVELNPNYYEAYLDIANIYDKLQNLEQAKKYKNIAKSLEKDANHNLSEYYIADNEDWICTCR